LKCPESGHPRLSDHLRPFLCPPEKRQKQFRRLMDEYLVEKGMKRDPKLSSGYFYGSESWLKEMRKKLREKMREKSKKLATGPPDDQK
jgi:hypothetical protein